jgi:hypothetical protein
MRAFCAAVSAVKGGQRWTLCSDRGQQRLNAHNVHHAGEIVGEHMQRHLGGNLGKRFISKCVAPIRIFSVPPLRSGMEKFA